MRSTAARPRDSRGVGGAPGRRHATAPRRGGADGGGARRAGRWPRRRGRGVPAHRLADMPEHGDEAARIAEAYGDLADAEVEVIVGSRPLGRRNDPQAAGHAEMQDQGSLAAVEQEVFRAARDGANPHAAQDYVEITRHGPPQEAMAHDHPGDLPSAQMRLEAEAGDFYFRKLWHEWLEPVFLGAAGICCCRAAEIYLN